MSRIDLSHNSAPLRGAMRPSLEEVNTLLRQDPLVVWDCPKVTSAATANKKYFWVKISWTAAFLSMGVAGFFAFPQGAAPSVKKPADTQQYPAPVAKRVVPLSSVKHSLYLVLRNPSAEFITYLGQLAAKGVTIRMVTTVHPPAGTGLTYSTVKSDRISVDGVLIDGTSWYEIGPDSRFE
jgi:hypothetical protein